METESTSKVTKNMALAVFAAILIAVAVSFSALGLQILGNAENHTPTVQLRQVSHISGTIGGKPTNPSNG